MFWFRAGKRTLDNELRNLIKEKKNCKIKSIIKTCNPSDLIDCTGTTIFHLAAKYSNIDLIKFLLDAGYDINVRNSYGTTPLTMAILHNNFEVVKLLLDADANILIANAIGENALRLLMQKKIGVPASVREHLIKRLKKISANAEDMARILLDGDCSLEFVLLLQEADVTEAMLRQTEEISIDRAYDLLLLAMESSYLDNVRVLLHYGSKAAYRREKFLENLVERIGGSPSELQSARPFLQRLADWKVGDASFVEFLQHVFEKSEKPVLEFLLECNVDEYVRTKFDMDLSAHVFINPNDSVYELLYRVDVNARGKNGQTGLHMATIHSIPERVQFLLDRAANPNVRDKKGQTPLSLAWDEKCIELLLHGDADVQVVDHTGLTIVEKQTKLTNSFRILLAHLALLEARGIEIKRKIYRKIKSQEQFKECYDAYRLQIDQMKTQEIRKSLTLFACLTDRPQNLMCYVEDDHETVAAALKCARNMKLHSFYLSTLKINLDRTLSMCHLT